MFNLFDDHMWFYFTRELKEKAPINLILSIACFWNYAEEIIETNLLQYFREFSYTLIHSFRVVFRLCSNQDHTCLVEGSELVELNFQPEGVVRMVLKLSWRISSGVRVRSSLNIGNILCHICFTPIDSTNAPIMHLNENARSLVRTFADGSTVHLFYQTCYWIEDFQCY